MGGKISSGLWWFLGILGVTAIIATLVKPGSQAPAETQALTGGLAQDLQAAEGN